ncbi:hypothetical protein ACHQM5_000834 [Ranunculus cassubicifolius]
MAARPNQQSIDTFISITGASQDIAIQKLEEHGGDLNMAVNSHFSEGDRSIHPPPVPASQNDFMDLDDDPVEVEPQRPLFPLPDRELNPFSLLDPDFRRRFLEGSSAELYSRLPRVTHPREVRQIPIEFRDDTPASNRSGLSPTIEDVTGSAYPHVPETRGTVIVDEDDEDIATEVGDLDDRIHGRNLTPSAPLLDAMADYANNDIEEEMIRAAIEASKREAVEGFPNQQIGVTPDSSGPSVQQTESHAEDSDIERAVSLSLKTAEQEKALREEKSIPSLSDVQEQGNTTSSRRQGIGPFNEGALKQPKLETGSSSVPDGEDEDIDEQPLVRLRSRRVSFGSDSAKAPSVMDESPPLSPGRHNIGSQPQSNGSAFPAEWGGISSEEHDEAVMLEAALFGGIPETTAYRFGYPTQERNQTDLDRDYYPRPAPRPPSPTLEAQRLLREQQDDEYLASLQADREKELKAIEEAETRRLSEQAAKEAALEEERQKEETERQLAAKEASLPMEPALGEENAVTLLVRMPDGNRRGRRFLKSDSLQSLFDFIDVGRVVKPGTYRLVRPYPRRAFSDGDSKLSLSELGLTSKQEALFLELI